MFDNAPDDPTHCSPTLDEAKRCVKLANRIGYKSEVVTIPFKSDPSKCSYAIQVPSAQPTAEKPVILLKSVNTWRNWLDSKLWDAQPFAAMWWDRFTPSHAKHKEKEIHKWIKEYKEVD